MLYNNFTLTQPDGSNEECVKMNADEYQQGDIGSWGDDSCSSTHPYICEIGLYICFPHVDRQIDILPKTGFTDLTVADKGFFFRSKTIAG